MDNLQLTKINSIDTNSVQYSGVVSYDKDSKSYFYIIGGSDQLDSNNSIYKYEVTNGTFSTPTTYNMPVAIESPVCVYNDNIIYIFGGYNSTDGKYLDTIYKFDCTTNQISLSSIKITYNYAYRCAYIDGKYICLTGGLANGSGVQKILRFNINNL